MNTETKRIVIVALLEHIINPLVAKLEYEAGLPIAVTLTLVIDGLAEMTIDAKARASAENARVCEIRVTFSKRTRWSAQGMFSPALGDTGFSGFALRGKLNSEDVPLPLRVISKVLMYNRFTWDEGLALDERP